MGNYCNSEKIVDIDGKLPEPEPSIDENLCQDYACHREPNPTPNEKTENHSESRVKLSKSKVHLISLQFQLQ